jgi:hypothetical protein
MKKSFQIISLVFLFALIACESVWYDQYVIKNETSHIVKIIGYYTNTVGPLRKPDTIVIQQKGEYLTFRQVGFHRESGTIFRDSDLDSIYIVFDNKKSIVQKCEGNQQSKLLAFCNITKNILLTNSFVAEPMTQRKGDKKGEKYTYYITEADYIRAK